MDQKISGKHSDSTGFKNNKNTFVKFAEIKMASTIFTRRNKCLISVLLVTVACIVLLLNAGVFSTSGSYTSAGICKLDDIPLQSDFDKKRFSGNWFATSTKGMENAIVASLLQFYDVKVNFVLEDDGNFLVKSVGGKFYGVWCPEGVGRLTGPNPDIPQRMEVLFDTPTGKSFGVKPVWLTKTDYTSYAVLYSCWDVTEDGFCEPRSAYIGVLQRSKDPLPAETLQEVHDAVRRSCINPDALKPVNHEGYCQKAQEAIS